MRPSLSLTIFALASNFGYGFSSIPTPLRPETSLVIPPSTFVVDAAGIGKTFVSSSSRYTATHSLARTSREQYLRLNSRGGAALQAGGKAPFSTGTQCPMRFTATILGSLWGSGGVLYILSKAIRRVLPIAMEPFTEGAVPLSQVQLVAYVATCLWFAYVEGYKGFQQKFAPLVVTRSFSLIVGQASVHHFLLAPFYSMGLIHATKKRMIVSWSVTMGVAAVVAAVKQLPYPYRNIIDAGVVAGLTWGSLSILLLYIRSWLVGRPPDIDPALPAIASKK